jgi:N6-L-threonylcarbamoyladenine synthase
MCLIASGGHTELVLMRGHGDFELVGQTRDDAAGEAFDKAARVLGLGYPGGPAVQKAAEGAPDTERLPRPLIPDTDDFSFSGLKTAVVRRARELGIYPVPRPGAERAAAALARAFQDAVADVLARKTSGAADRAGCGGVVLVGGVAANRALRARLAEESSVPVAAPHISLCTDNGAMIAMAGWQMYEAGLRPAAAPDVEPGLQVGPLWGVSAATVQRTG